MKRESLLHSTVVYILWNHCYCFIESMFSFLGKTRTSSKTCCKIMFFHTRTRWFLRKAESFQEWRTWIQSEFTGCKHQSQWLLESWYVVGRCRILRKNVTIFAEKFYNFSGKFYDFCRKIWLSFLEHLTILQENLTTFSRKFGVF